MTARYTPVAITLHWIIAVLILGQIAGGLYMSNLPEGDPALYDLFQLHKSFGVVILLLSLGRLGWRLTHPAPALPEGMKPWEKTVAAATHWIFYGLMIGVPVLGWAVVSASPLQFPTVVFDLVPWPHLPLPHSGEVAGVFSELHEIAAFATLGLFVLHVGAALKHHIKDKDDVLTRMVPFLKR